jgi:hypothetical protein
MTRQERLEYLAKAERAIHSARSALAHGRYATYSDKVLSALGILWMLGYEQKGDPGETRT